MEVLTIENLSFQYKKGVNTLCNINVAIEGQRIHAILGKNGCGKSTLLDCIIGYNAYKIGKIAIDGTDLKKMPEKMLAKKIAYIPQNTTVSMDYTVFEFLLFGRNCHLKFGQAPKKADYEFVQICARKVGIENLLNKTINKISGGERALVFVARALVQESNLIIMDEPTANLDFGNQAKLFSLMQELKNDGKTIVFTTHNPNHAIELDCNVIAMQSGKILFSGRAKEVLSQEEMLKIYGMEFVIEQTEAFTIKMR